MSKSVLITGVAGFIGSQLAKRYLSKNWQVVGIDNINNYYSQKLKKTRLKHLACKNFSFHKLDISNSRALESVFASTKPSIVLHFAAEAGVRHSIDNPQAFVTSNLAGFLSVIECCRKYPTRHLLYASSSSVYGLNESSSLSEQLATDHPTSFYAASKKANEVTAHAYAYALGVKSTGMRFFSVYGPWGRPDMAYWIFTNKISNGQPIELFNRGKHNRDLLYIDDLVESIYRLAQKPPKANPQFNPLKPKSHISSSPYRIVNIGGGRSISLFDMVKNIEQGLGKKAKIILKPRQKADSLDTKAQCSNLSEIIGYKPITTPEQGLRKFVDWFKENKF